MYHLALNLQAVTFCCSSFRRTFQFFWSVILLCSSCSTVVCWKVSWHQETGKNWLCQIVFLGLGRGEFCIVQCDSLLKNQHPGWHPVLKVCMRPMQLASSLGSFCGERSGLVTLTVCFWGSFLTHLAVWAEEVHQSSGVKCASWPLTIF